MNNPSNHRQKVAEEIMSKLNEAFLKTLDMANIKQAEQMTGLIETCRKYKIDPDDIKDATDSRRLDEIKESVGWTETAILGPDKFFSKIANKIVGMLMEKASPRILDLTLENIDIKTDENKRSVKFDVDLFSQTIKPWVQFSLVTPPTNTKQKLLRINFQLKVSANISPCEIKFGKKEKKISGTLHTEIKSSVIGFDTLAAHVATEIDLVEQAYDIKLFDLTLSRNSKATNN